MAKTSFEAAVELPDASAVERAVEQLGQSHRHRGHLPIRGGDDRDRQGLGGDLATAEFKLIAELVWPHNGYRGRQVEIDLPFNRIGLERQNEKRQKLKRHIEHGGQIQTHVLLRAFLRVSATHDLAPVGAFIAPESEFPKAVLLAFRQDFVDQIERRFLVGGE